jgi:hypothetical protein
MALIFVAMPSKGAVLNNAIRPTVLACIAELHIQHPENTFIAPMVQDYQLLPFMPKFEATWADWGRHCRKLIERSDQVWVLTYDGYDTSVGVAGEIEHAVLRNIPVLYVEPCCTHRLNATGPHLIIPMNYERANQTYISYGRFAKTASEHARHWSALKKFETKFFAAREPNPSLPAWGTHPRAGAAWSGAENLALIENFKDQVREDARLLGYKELCELAYLHGRTASAIEAQLKKVLSYSTFYNHFQMQ